jgi:PCO_ADO
MQFFQNDTLPTAKFEDSVFECDESEISPGVVLERRMMLGGGLGFLAALFSPVTSIAFGQELTKKVSNRSDSEIIELETLIATLRPEARRLIASEKPDEEKYVQMAIKELSKVNKLDTYRFMPSRKGGWETDFQAFVPPVLLYQIRMSPNSVIDLHDHRHHNGALSVREGTVRVRSFDIFQEEQNAKWDVAAGNVPGVGEEFLIQEKSELSLKVGQAAGLTRTRENIHQIEAGPNGCLLYDLFTNFKMNAQSFEIQWDGKYFDSAKKLCKVNWIAPDHSHD